MLLEVYRTIEIDWNNTESTFRNKKHESAFTIFRNITSNKNLYSTFSRMNYISNISTFSLSFQAKRFSRILDSQYVHATYLCSKDRSFIALGIRIFITHSIVFSRTFITHCHYEVFAKYYFVLQNNNFSYRICSKTIKIFYVQMSRI